MMQQRPSIGRPIGGRGEVLLGRGYRLGVILGQPLDWMGPQNCQRLLSRLLCSFRY